MTEKHVLHKNRIMIALCAIVIATASYLNPATVFGQTPVPNIILYEDAAMTVPKNVFERGDIVYAKSVNLVTTDYYIHTVTPPVGTGSEQIIVSCTLGVTELTSSFDTDGDPLSYGLSGGASCPGTLTQQQDGQYKYRLKIFADATSCNNGTPTKGGTSGIKTALFRVAQAYPFADATDRDACLSDATCDENVVESFCPGDNVFMAVRGYIPCNSKVGYQFIRPDGTPVGLVLEMGTTATGNLYLPSFAIPTGSADYLGQWEIKVGPIITSGGIHSFRTETANVANTVILDAFNVEINNSITVHKFHDANLDGTQGAGELDLEGWQMTLSGDASGVAYTDADGNATFSGLPNGEYTVTEGSLSNWIPTNATAQNVTFEETNLECSSATLNFGNVCIGGATNAKSKGWWGNKNGLKEITASYFCQLNDLCLRNLNGTPYDPIAGCPNPTTSGPNNQLSSARSSFDIWLQQANASNMASMLSAQLAAMKLNVLKGNVSLANVIYAPGTNSADAFGFASIFAIMNEANTLLCTGGTDPLIILGGDPLRERAGALKDALDRGNNNQNFLLNTSCEIDFGQQGQARMAASATSSPDGVSLTTYPNPLSDKTTISYTLTEAANVSLVVYDGFGKQIAVLHNGEKAAGTYSEDWKPANLAAGIYFCRLVLNSANGAQHLQTTKMLLIK